MEPDSNQCERRRLRNLDPSMKIFRSQSFTLFDPGALEMTSDRFAPLDIWSFETPPVPDSANPISSGQVDPFCNPNPCPLRGSRVAAILTTETGRIFLMRKAHRMEGPHAHLH